MVRDDHDFQPVFGYDRRVGCDGRGGLAVARVDQGNSDGQAAREGNTLSMDRLAVFRE